MSKTVKRKITVELPKPRDLSKNRLSVFQRLGTKKLKSLETAVNINTKPKELKTNTPVVTNIAPEPKPDNVELEDADPDSLEKKREELQKELELQLKMETSRKVAPKEIVRKRKKVRSSSSSSSSSSDSGSSSDSSSSTSSKESKRKIRKGKIRKRGSSSSSDEPRKKSAKIKRVCHKKVDGSKSHKSTHGKKLLEGKIRKRSQSPPIRKRQGSSPPKSAQKIPPKSKLSVENVAKHHRMKEATRDRDREFQIRDRDREKDKDRERMRSRERIRSRSPKMRPKSRTPKRLSSRDLKHKSPPRRIGGSSGGGMRRDRSIDRVVKKDFKRHDSRERERERREKERICREDAREAAREKERQEILARCQERHERERLAREKLRRERDDDRIKPDRLIPRPAERAMAIAAARDRSRDKSIDRDRLRSVSHTRSARDRMEREKEPNPYDRVYERDDSRYDSHDRRMEKDDRGGIRDERDYIRRHDDVRPDAMNSPYLTREKRIVERDDMEWEAGGHNVVSDQRYDDLREDRRHEYGSRGYIDERHLAERDREWIRESEMGRTDDRGMYDRIIDRHVGREWDRGDASHPLPRDNYVDNREWSGGINERQWENKGKWQQQQEEEEDWDEDDSKWQDYNRISEPIHHDTGMSSAIGNMGMNDVQRGGTNRRWNSWRGRRGSQHHSGDFRRQQDGMFQHDRSSMVYRRPPDAAPTETISQSNLTEAVTVHPSTGITHDSLVGYFTNIFFSFVFLVTSIQPMTPKSDVSVSTVIGRSSLTQVIVTEVKADEKKDDAVDDVPMVSEEQLLEEVIPDDLSDFSDEADEILNRQEEDDLGILSTTLEKTSPIKQLEQQNFNLFNDERDVFGSSQYFRPDYESELLEKQNSQNALIAPIDQCLETTVTSDAAKDTEPLLVEKQVTSVESKSDVNDVKDIPDDIPEDAFEEISDGELEEEARIRGLGDALGVDWASLVEESKVITLEKSIPTQTSAKQRWQPSPIVLDAGVSHKFASEALLHRVLVNVQVKLKKERDEQKHEFQDMQSSDRIFKVKEEKLDSEYGDIQESSTCVPLSFDDIKKEENGLPTMNHTVACMQGGNRYYVNARKNIIFKASGPSSRALSAQPDLHIRRVEIDLPEKAGQCLAAVRRKDIAFNPIISSSFVKENIEFI
ncbi:Fl(2)d-associated complex component [Pseudolycoriella hygida]|uniref:Fl(2)d-associated complex component n=1 Tax=Pseudolycoriella hygida TaxID=35572 RepID=A0A9Q0MVT4_9DIPT|nr:Fl(2)d-associated complex component [Pseudolycoriella hygida]